MPTPPRILPLLCLVTAMSCLPSWRAMTQDVGDMQIFGSMQSIMFHQESRLRQQQLPSAKSIELSEARTTFALQQLDFFFDKQFGNEFSAFVDLEYQLNYSSEKRWGSLSIQEAWMNYRLSDAFNVKLGLLFPAFNNFNEMKNRLAVQPYIFRPLVYERLLSSRFMTEDYIPEHAYAQVSGQLPWGNYFADYAVYMGNSESSYISHYDGEGNIITDLNPNFEFLSGVDPTDISLKLFGGRFGIRSRNEHLKAGISITRDANNMHARAELHSGIFSQEALLLLPDDARRFRFGTDLSLRHAGFTFEGEIIKVAYELGRAEALNLLLEQWFAYWVLGYDVTENLYPYVSMQWGDYNFGVDSDYFIATTGFALRLNAAITAKAQWVLFSERASNVPLPGDLRIDSNLRMFFYLFGLSVLL